jgi:hypothetical protein
VKRDAMVTISAYLVEPMALPGLKGSFGGMGCRRRRRKRPAVEGRFDSFTQGHPDGGNVAQTRRSGRPPGTAESGGQRTPGQDTGIVVSARAVIEGEVSREDFAW